MSENVVINPGSGGQTISADDLATLNGAGSSGVVIQRVKVCYGADSDANDVATATPLPIVAPTLTKGAQGSTGHSVQALKDAGRAIVNAATTVAGVTCVSAEAMLNMDVSRDGASTSSVTTISVTSGKRYRITAITAGLISTSAAVLSARVMLRMTTSGAVATTSPIVVTIPLSSAPAIAQQGAQLIVHIPDGLEISGTKQIGLSHVASATTGTIWASIVGYEY